MLFDESHSDCPPLAPVKTKALVTPQRKTLPRTLQLKTSRRCMLRCSTSVVKRFIYHVVVRLKRSIVITKYSLAFPPTISAIMLATISAITPATMWSLLSTRQQAFMGCRHHNNLHHSPFILLLLLLHSPSLQAKERVAIWQESL